MWIEIYSRKPKISIDNVTFREEGVDWNLYRMVMENCGLSVTFREEGVDWNKQKLRKVVQRSWSPSARKVWIEILQRLRANCSTPVTFREEGVDWNTVLYAVWTLNRCHLPRGRCGLKYIRYSFFDICFSHLPRGRCGLKYLRYNGTIQCRQSPSARKVWIEIKKYFDDECLNEVTFREEGVDWNRNRNCKWAI